MSKIITLSKKICGSFDSMLVNRIGVIGGGPATVSFCLQLMEQLKSNPLKNPLEIFVFEKNKKIGPGLPYAQNEPAYILNLPKDSMEPVYGRSGEFSSWLKTHYPDVCTKYPPRYMFGEYLHHLACKFQVEAKDYGIKVKYFTDTVISNIIQLREKKFSIQSTDAQWETDYVVLATGSMPSESYREFSNNPNYGHNPRDNKIFSKLKDNETIGIIGTRLSAIDIAVKLLRKKHKGRIIMASRTGLLPAVLANEIPAYSLKYFRSDAFSGSRSIMLESIVDLLFKEISFANDKHYNFNSITKSYRDITALDWLGREIRHSEVGSKLWQQILFAIYPTIPSLWSKMDLSDQKKFMVQYNSTFMTYLAAFPLNNAYKIRGLLQSGQLTVMGGLNLQYRNGHYNLQNSSECIKTQYLLNATGPGYDIASQSLYRKMLNQGLIQQHPLGGLSLNPETLQVLSSKGQEVKGVFAMGELTKGKFWAITDMQRVAQQAKQIATVISQNISVFSTFKSMKSNNKTFSFFFNGIQKRGFSRLAINSINNNVTGREKYHENRY